MEKLDVKRLREEGVVRARGAFKAARTTQERHSARLALQKALRAQGGDNSGILGQS